MRDFAVGIHRQRFKSSFFPQVARLTAKWTTLVRKWFGSAILIGSNQKTLDESTLCYDRWIYAYLLSTTWLCSMVFRETAISRFSFFLISPSQPRPSNAAFVIIKMFESTLAQESRQSCSLPSVFDRNTPSGTRFTSFPQKNSDDETISAGFCGTAESTMHV